MVAFVGASAFSLWQLVDANEWVRHTGDVRRSLTGLWSSMLDAQAGASAYAVTGDADMLLPYQRAQAGWRDQLAHLRGLTADNARQQARLADLEQRIGAQLDALAAVRAQSDRLAAKPELASAIRAAKVQLDALRRAVGDLQDEEARLDATRRRDVTRRWRATLALFVGTAILFFGVAVAERRQRSRAQEQQEASEARFRFMVENVKDYAIITLDRDGRVTSWNRGAQEIKGWSADEILGQHFSRFYPDEDVRAGKIERELELVAREGRFEEEGWRVRKDGSRFWANVVINGIRDDKGLLVGYTKVTRDLTERKKAAAALAEEQQRRAVAEQESRFAQMFIAVLGHDLRNPLNAIAMAARLLKKKIGRADPKVIDRIASSAERMSNMVTQLLDLTRNRLAGGITIEKREADVSEIVSSAVEELRLVYPERDIRWTARAHCRCAWDSGRMAQVVSNLVGNALEHSPDDTPVTVQLDTVGQEVVLTVHNDGTPIPPELIDSLFDPYRRNSVRSARSKGLGLGLFITQQLVHAHGGRIDVRSTAEEGTTFTVSIPCSASANVVVRSNSSTMG